ncbi:MAG: hypothetical protein U9Q70_03320 [Chloroflexota bacterium]|nr:hypothetical protein [Chloroflexota bacterium]
MQQITYHGWKNCYRLANQQLELVITADVGPRVIRCGFIGDENEFWEDPILQGQTGGAEWVNYGGHRLWHAPEVMPRTYAPDNGPVTVSEVDGWLRFQQPVESSTGIQKTMEVRLDVEEAQVEVTHRLRNTNLWTVELAPWALSVMAPGGTAILPLPPRGLHEGNLTPTSTLALWAYTDLRDPRWTWGTRYLLLRQDPHASTPQKIGARVPDGWLAYARRGHLFVKTFAYAETGTYPDRGCNVEFFTSSAMLELETLGQLVRLAPGTEVLHREQWHLYDQVPLPTNDDEVVKYVLPRLT